MKHLTKPLILAAGVALWSPTAFANDFEEVDIDHNGYLTQDEFDDFASDMDLDTRWDKDDDGFLSEDEYGDIGVDANFADYDQDNDDLLDGDEFYDGVFTAYDENEDGHWDDGEWDDANEAGLFDV